MVDSGGGSGREGIVVDSSGGGGSGICSYHF